MPGSNAIANFNWKLPFDVLCRKIIIPSNPPSQPPKALNQSNRASDTRSPIRPARHLSYPNMRNVTTLITPSHANRT